MTRHLVALFRFLLGIAMAFAANFAAGFLAPASASLHHFDLFYRTLLLLFLLAGFSVLLAGFDRVPGNPLVNMGLGLRGPWRRDLWIGGLFGAGMVAVSVTMVAIFGTLTIHLNVTAASLRSAVVILLILASGAMAEEVAFRGYPFQRMVEAMGPTGAAILLSVLFGAVHLANPYASAWGYFDTVLIGLMLSLAYLRTRSLWMPIGIHFWWNVTLGLIFGLPVSGLTEFSAITRARAEGPLWLTGGSYGIEASTVVAVVIILGIFLVYATVPSRAQASPIPQIAEQQIPGPIPAAPEAAQPPSFSPQAGQPLPDLPSELPPSGVPKDTGN